MAPPKELWDDSDSEEEERKRKVHKRALAAATWRRRLIVGVLQASTMKDGRGPQGEKSAGMIPSAGMHMWGASLQMSSPGAIKPCMGVHPGIGTVKGTNSVKWEPSRRCSCYVLVFG